MKFMMMMQGTKAGWDSMSTWSPADIQGHIQYMQRIAEDLTASGELVLAEGLDMPANAKIVRSQKSGAPAITDGPFPEAKEFLAGFWIVEVDSAKRAIELAARASAAPGKGGVPLNFPIEVRQVMSAPDVEM
jgi:hypothetical protein